MVPFSDTRYLCNFRLFDVGVALCWLAPLRGASIPGHPDDGSRPCMYSMMVTVRVADLLAAQRRPAVGEGALVHAAGENFARGGVKMDVKMVIFP